MHTAEIRITDDLFVAHMSRMRAWLDSRRWEPAVFRYQHVDGAIVIRVDFALETEAAAFASEFGGALLR